MNELGKLLTPSTAVGRWSGLGPYYAMFPRKFAFEVIAKHCPPGGAVLDPFAGRGTSVFASAALGRAALGVEINPVGWIFGQAKLDPAPKDRVLKRVEDIDELATLIQDEQLEALPEFFQKCFSKSVLSYLIQARSTLNWKNDRTDRTLMAIILVHLHGRRDQSLSNQMRQSKAMSPKYATKWWDEHELSPPELAPAEFLRDRIRWRYAKGVPELASSSILLGDCTQQLEALSLSIRDNKFDLLFTSPPYCGVTNYHYDQWLRLWLLGWPPAPSYSDGLHKSKFASRDEYTSLLRNSFLQASRLLADQASVYVRTDAREFTRTTTKTILKEVFPEKLLLEFERPYIGRTQTSLYGDKQGKPGEIDFILSQA